MAEEQNNIQVNEFKKGLVKDLDPTLVPNDMWIDASNIRILTKGGQGFIVTNIEDIQEEFSLDLGYIPLGWTSYGGVLYIVSMNPSTGNGQIGTFPSIDWTGIPNFTRDYRALQNYDTGIDLDTDLFGFSPFNQVSVICKPSFDGSVDLFLCDYLNPNRVINSGFDQEGNITGRLVTPESFGSWANMIMRTNETPIITLNDITAGGSLKFGNYIFFLRYLTDTLDSTHFVAQSNACQVYDGNINQQYDAEGGNGALTATLSNKKVILNIFECDTSYTFLEVGFIRYYSDPNGQTIYEVALINKRYDITSATIEINGNEGEQTLTLEELTASKINEDVCKDHVTLEDRYWGANWKGTHLHHISLKEFASQVKINYDDSVQIDGNHLDPGASIDDILANRQGQHKHFGNTYDYVGYFRGETYPFGMVFEFNDGSESAVYQIRGGDDLTLLGPASGTWESATNPSGVYRFPDNANSNMMINAYPNNLLQLLGVKFNITTARGFAYMSAANQAWFKANVRAFYWVRGDRRETLQYQGVIIHCSVPEIDAFPSLDYVPTDDTTLHVLTAPLTYSPVNNSNWGGHQFYAPTNVYCQNKYSFTTRHEVWGAVRSVGFTPLISITHFDKFYPIWRGYMPMEYFDGATTVRNYVSRWFAKKNKYAFYSPDFLVQENNHPLDINYMCRIARTFNYWDKTDSWDWTLWDVYGQSSFAGIYTGKAIDMYPKIILTEPTEYRYSARTVSSLKARIIGEDTFSRPSSEDEFINYHWGADRPDLLYGEFENIDLTGERIKTRSCISPKYIGIDTTGVDGDDLGIGQNFALNIVNLYNQDIYSVNYTTLKSWFNKTTKYYKISQVIKQDNGGGTWWSNYFNTEIFFKGDCFLQRSYFKQCSWYDPDETKQNDVDSGFAGGDVNVYTHGTVVGVVTENKYNVAMRMKTDNGNNYYPRVRNPYTFCWQMYSQSGAESFWYNNGYHKVVGPMEYTPYDYSIPTRDETYPVRVRWSNEQVPGEIANSFRKMLYGNYRDFDIQYGPINAAVDMNGWLCTIQDESINRHYVNEKQIQEAGLTGALTLGTGEILPSQFTRLANFGTQHLWSVTKTGNLRYGVDWNKRSIWCLGFSTSDSRGLYPTVRNLSKEKMCEKLVYDLFDAYSPRTDIINKLPDNPVFTGGINTGFDWRYNETLFTFNLVYVMPIIIDYDSHLGTYYFIVDNDIYNIADISNPVIIYINETVVYVTISSKRTVGSITYYNVNEDLSAYEGDSAYAYVYQQRQTIVYNEDLDMFLGSRTWTPQMYMTLNKELFSYYTDYSELEDNIYRHNIPGTKIDSWYIQFVVNGKSPATKVYDSMVVDCPLHTGLVNNYLFETIDYATETQSSQHTPLYEISDTSVPAGSKKNWIDPRYKENKMYVPVLAETTASGHTPMRGTWLSVKLTFNEALDTYVKNVITKFRNSNS